MKSFIRRTTWRTSDKMAAVFFLILAAWVAVPSHMLLRPEGLSVSATGKVTFVRSVPAGQVSARWWEEIRVASVECHAYGGPTTYQVGPDGHRYGVTVQYQMSADLWRCASMGGPFTLAQTHRVYLLGALPMRPSEALWRCVADGSPCARVDV